MTDLPHRTTLPNVGMLSLLVYARHERQASTEQCVRHEEVSQSGAARLAHVYPAGGDVRELGDKISAKENLQQNICPRR